MRESINHLIDTLLALNEDTQLIVKAVEAGHFRDARADASKHSGIYFDIINGLNNLMDALTKPMLEIFNTLEELSKGNLQARMVNTYNGNLEVIKQNMNSTLDSLPLTEILAVMEAMADGDLTVNMTREYQGENQKIKEAVNHTLLLKPNLMLIMQIVLIHFHAKQEMLHLKVMNL